MWHCVLRKRSYVKFCDGIVPDTMGMVEVFLHLSALIVITTVIAVVVRILRQPLIIAYILSGVFVSAFILNFSSTIRTLETFSHIGIAFLLFIVGLHMSPRIIREVGITSIVAGLGHFLITTLAGYYLALWLGFVPSTAIFIAIAFSFSSTIVVLKLVADKRELFSLHGKITTGFLLVQDIIAAIFLIVISTLAQGGNSIHIVVLTAFWGVVLLLALYVFSAALLPRLSVFLAQSQELLFLFAVSWGLGIAALFQIFGFSLEIGALAAGVALSVSPFSYSVSAKLRPLRDFFLLLFFIFLGSQTIFGDISLQLVPIIWFSLLVLVINPLAVMAIIGFMGYRKRTSFMTGISIAQISEFSFIVILAGIHAGYISQPVLSLTTVVGLITIAISTYFIIYANKIYTFFSPILSLFEKRHVRNSKKSRQSYDTMLFGYDRIGHDLLGALKRFKRSFLVIDYNPNIIQLLVQEKVPYRYGDVSDGDFLDELNYQKTSMIISTIPNFEVNALIIAKAKSRNPKIVTIVVSHQINEALQLYDLGAGYVIMPHFLGGKYVSLLLKRYGAGQEQFKRIRERHLRYLEKRKKRGHEHPKQEERTGPR